LRLDFLVVAFSGEAGLLRLQARSMARYLDPAAVGRIFVVDNDDAPGRFATLFEATIRPAYGALATQVELVPAAALVAPATPCGGYWRQQAAKLRGYRLGSEAAFVVLDCKNAFVRPVSARTFVAPDGRLLAPRRRPKQHLSAALAYFGLASGQWPEFIIDIYTPVPMWREQCAALDAAVERREGFGVDELLARAARGGQPRLLEFLLYGAFLEAEAGGIARHHALRTMLSATYMCATPDQSAEVPLARLENHGCAVMGVHRRSAGAPEAVRRSLAAAWLRFGLVRSEAEGMAVLANPGC
jgi:hypothetical protein